jgi:hypothetical protein
LVGSDGVADLAEAADFDGERVGVGDRPAEHVLEPADAPGEHPDRADDA